MYVLAARERACVLTVAVALLHSKLLQDKLVTLKSCGIEYAYAAVCTSAMYGDQLLLLDFASTLRRTTLVSFSTHARRVRLVVHTRGYLCQ